MKRFTYAMVMAVALILMVSSFAFAGDDCAKTKTAEASQAKMGDCCVTAAKAGEGCCGKDADAVKAAYASQEAACAAKKASCTTAQKAACTSAEKASCTSAEKAACTSADKAAYKAASASMGECCTTAVAESKGCCGKSAEELELTYTTKAEYFKAAAVVKADMHKCCATALDAGEGCCGHSAEDMKADYNKKVEAQTKKVASTEKASADS